MSKKIITVVLFLLLLTSCKSQSTGSLNVYNWGDYIDMETVRMFEEETGIKVNYTTFASNEDLYVKVKNSSDAFDVICPSDYMIERMIREDLIQKIDLNTLENFKELDQGILYPPFDPTNEYSIPYFWGTLGIVYNTENIKDEITSFKDLWNPDYKGRIIMYNSQRDSLAVALRMLGYSVNTTDKKELQEAKEALIAQKPLVYAYLTDEGRDVVVQEDADIIVMYSGDALNMVEQNPKLKYVIPEEGTNLWFDSWAIPSNAKNKEDAQKFIDFMCRPEIAAINAEYCVGYSSPVVKTRDILPEELGKNEEIYPGPEVISKLEVYTDIEGMRPILDRLWTEVIATMN